MFLVIFWGSVLSNGVIQKEMNKKTAVIVSVAVALAVLILPKLPFLQADAKNSTGGLMVDNVLAVKAFVVQPVRFQDRILTTGTVLANEEVELRSETSGKIVAIHFQEGSKVKKGQLLVKINDAELRAQLTKAEHQVSLAEVKEFRQRSLLQTEGISQQEYDIALNELNTRKAEVALIKAQIEKTEIRAPFDGVVGLRYVSEGSYVSTSSKIAALQNADPVKIDFSIPERYAHVIRKGDQIRFTIQGAEGVFGGEVYAIEPKIDPITRSVQLRAIAPNNNGTILPGSFSKVELVLQEVEDALMVPTESIIPHIAGQRVILYQNGTAHLRDVETGSRTEQSILVTKGLSSGDTILTTGLLQVRDGMPVRIREIQ